MKSHVLIFNLWCLSCCPTQTSSTSFGNFLKIADPYTSPYAVNGMAWQKLWPVNRGFGIVEGAALASSWWLFPSGIWISQGSQTHRDSAAQALAIMLSVLCKWVSCVLLRSPMANLCKLRHRHQSFSAFDKCALIDVHLCFCVQHIFHDLPRISGKGYTTYASDTPLAPCAHLAQSHKNLKYLMPTAKNSISSHHPTPVW